MRVVLTEPFVRKLIAAPPEIPKLFGKQLANLLRDLRHRSLDAKKFPESGDPDMWSARVNGGWRFYFTIAGDTYTMHNIQAHPK
ncbi:MAG: pyridoxamine 5'-phosphate oxidase family protein [Deltaproteobacteria bacterium]|nr:pyridoxamine 5'-phosphate oxidase family protein [Deltaproteobacteria bacterium]